ncbi:DGQHR domain-containing protein [Chromobacterium haemolyticum]|uniref:DGQHR domain-containing protein n=1 Tax=Chromobacterium fluminis TaxID=3044269 RepID=A0ABX0LDB5_9NEIS|nr:DNA sulfur modification protein DndB [Chromobacterium haemolyticum]NHR07406.1 DGQHR domain-containing protein [Chromobacterium haemolyticum]
MQQVNKHYVIALCGVTIGRQFHSAGTIIGIYHDDDFNARQKAHEINRKSGADYGRRVAAIESAEPLKKGDLRMDLVEAWERQELDRRKLELMKDILRPESTGVDFNQRLVTGELALLKISLDELRALYEVRARESLEEDERMAVLEAEDRARRNAALHDVRKLELQRDEITYTFPAVRGIQAGRAYYVAQVPYGVLAKLFKFDEEVVPAECRAQRVLNTRRAGDIADYMVANPIDYVLPALTASVSAEMAFEPVALPGASDRVGMLSIPISATMLINDGQHRRKGIELALAQRPAFAKETIAVTLYFDQGLARSQQMFADINAKQVKPSSAINALYDHRNPFNAFVLKLLDHLPKLKSRIDFENASPGAKSHKLWSLVVVRKFITLLTGVSEKNIAELEPAMQADWAEVLNAFFQQCAQHIPQWDAMMDNRVAASQVREEWVIGHAVWLEALALFGRQLLNRAGTAEQVNWAPMAGLATLDPQKSSKLWEGRCVVLGKMQKTSDGVKSTAAQLLKAAGLPLTSELEELEQRLTASMA